MPSDFRLDRERGISAVRFEIPLAGGRGFGGVEGTRPPRFSPEGKRKKGDRIPCRNAPDFCGNFRDPVLGSNPSAQ
jgi:hypothetical protein